MSDKIKLEFVSDILFYKCACVGDDWEEKYKDNPTVLSLVSKLVSAETPEDDGISEAMEELIMELGDGERTYLNNNGDFTVDGEVLEDIDEYDEDDDELYSVYEGSLYLPGDFRSLRDVYWDLVQSSKVCVLEEIQNKNHIASLEIDAPFDAKKLKYKDGWIEYDGESFESEESQGNAIDRELYVDGREPMKLDYIATLENIGILIGTEYTDLVGLPEGTRFTIKVGNKSIRLERIEEDEE